MIHWQGGIHTELHVARRRRGMATRTSPDIISAVRSLARVCTDTQIAGHLNRNDLKTGRGNRWTQERVTSLRTYHGIVCDDPETQRREDWFTLPQASKFLGISNRTLRLAVEQEKISGCHPFPDGPWILTRADLETTAAQLVAQQARQRHDYHPAIPHPNQRTIDVSGT